MRFHPDTIDNEPWQDLYVAKYSAERAPKLVRPGHVPIGPENTTGHGTRAETPSETPTKPSKRPVATAGKATGTSPITFYDIVSPYMSRHVSQEDHAEANAVLARIRAKLSESDDELLKDALGKLCKVECGKILLYRRKQPPSAA